jgi:hypothetical protein
MGVEKPRPELATSVKGKGQVDSLDEFFET